MTMALLDQGCKSGNQTVDCGAPGAQKSFSVRSMEHNRDTDFSSCHRRVNFMTVGLEGAGHHLFEAMPKSLCGDVKGRRHTKCGGQYSWPHGGEWRHSGAIKGSGYDTVPEMVHPTGGKHLILMRDMVDQTFSSFSPALSLRASIVGVTCWRAVLTFSLSDAAARSLSTISLSLRASS